VKEVDHEQERVDRIKAESAVKKAEALKQVMPLSFSLLSNFDLTSIAEKG
jgi:hypothetical protein